jgi:ribonuclease P protein component
LKTSAGEKFTKSDRLLKRSEFEKVQRSGRKITTEHLVILWLPNKLNRSRLGIVTSKKVGKSVIRNRIRRVIREVFRRNRWLFPASSDVVVIPRKDSRLITYQEIVEELSARGKSS